MHLSEFMKEVSEKSDEKKKESTCSFVEMMETPQITEDEPIPVLNNLANETDFNTQDS